MSGAFLFVQKSKWTFREICIQVRSMVQLFQSCKIHILFISIIIRRMKKWRIMKKKLN